MRHGRRQRVDLLSHLSRQFGDFDAFLTHQREKLAGEYRIDGIGIGLRKPVEGGLSRAGGIHNESTVGRVHLRQATRFRSRSSKLVGDKRVLAASIEDKQTHPRPSFLQIEEKFGDANRLALNLLLPAILHVRNIAGNEEVQPLDLDAVAGEVKRHDIVFRHLQQELLPFGIERRAACILQFGDFEAKVSKSMRHGSRIVDSAL